MFIEKSVQCVHPDGVHDVVYSEFPGDPAKTVICVHGLSRNGRDFDWLAQVLAINGYRVICPDMPGRGRSRHFNNPAYYNYPQYASDLNTLITHLGVTSVDWIGTSMGGLLGMMLAAQPNSPIKRLIINDIGPFIPADALERIKKYVGMNPTYSDWDGFYNAFQKRMVPFGLKTTAEWDFLAHISAHEDLMGRYRMNYDARIVSGMGDGPITDLNLWPLWAIVKQPVLILHGAESDVLNIDTVHQMMIGKQASSVSFSGVGHAPALLAADQINVVKNWIIS